MKKVLLGLILFGGSFSLLGQQDIQLTHYMYDKMSFNPASTGMDDGYCGTMIYRNQWDKVAGAPNSVLVNGQARLKNYKSGVGFSFVHDAIGFMRNNYFKLNYSFQHYINGVGYASAGIGLGMQNLSVTPNWITPQVDPAADAALSPTLSGVAQTNFDMNFGLYFKGDLGYYAGLSAGHLTSPNFNNLGYQAAMHYYVFGGIDLDNQLVAVFPAQLKVMPSILLKSAAATTQLDLTARAMWNDQFYGGIGYRLQDAVSILVGFQTKVASSKLADQYVKIGYSYDVTTSALNQYSVGTHEIMLNYCYVPKMNLPRERAVNPRFL